MARACRRMHATAVRLPYSCSVHHTLSRIFTSQSPPTRAGETRCMHTQTKRLTRIALLLGLLALLAGCGGGRDGDDEASGDAATEAAGGSGDLSGRIEADGSSTVGPFDTGAERFQRENPDVQVTVGVSGTGGGFERFCRGETDLSNASRPIKDEESTICEDAGIDFTEFQVANDALTVVVNPENDWATCLTVDQYRPDLKKPGSKVNNWNQVDTSFPDQALKLFGAGTDSGTFDYFTDVINGEEGASRSDYSATEDDNVTVTGVSGDKGALGYFGFSYFEENQDKLKAVEIDDGDGCVAPSVEERRRTAPTRRSRARSSSTRRTSRSQSRRSRRSCST